MKVQLGVAFLSLKFSAEARARNVNLEGSICYTSENKSHCCELGSVSTSVV